MGTCQKRCYHIFSVFEVYGIAIKKKFCQFFSLSPFGFTCFDTKVWYNTILSSYIFLIGFYYKSRIPLILYSAFLVEVLKSDITNAFFKFC